MYRWGILTLKLVLYNLIPRCLFLMPPAIFRRICYYLSMSHILSSQTWKRMQSYSWVGHESLTDNGKFQDHVQRATLHFEENWTLFFILLTTSSKYSRFNFLVKQCNHLEQVSHSKWSMCFQYKLSFPFLASCASLTANHLLYILNIFFILKVPYITFDKLYTIALVL